MEGGLRVVRLTPDVDRSLNSYRSVTRWSWEGHGSRWCGGGRRSEERSGKSYGIPAMRGRDSPRSEWNELKCSNITPGEWNVDWHS